LLISNNDKGNMAPKVLHKLARPDII